MAEQGKSVDQFLRDLREEVDIPEGMSDSDVMKKLLASPKGKALLEKQGVAMSEVRTKMKPDTGGPVKRFAGGMASPLVEGVQGMIEQTFNQAQRGKDLQATKGRFKGAAQSAFETSTAPMRGTLDTLTHPGSLIDLPGIKKDIQSGDYSGAAGRGTSQALMWGSAFKGLRGAGAAKIGEMEKLTSLTEKITAPIAETLSEQGNAIKSGMTGQLSNVAAMRGNPIFRKVIARLGDLETAPGTPKGAVSAAKDALTDLSNRVSGGKATTWEDLFEMNKKLKAANAQIKDPATRGMIKRITDLTGDELQQGADKAGLGKQFQTWQKHYKEFSDFRRTYDDILRGKTDTQLETKATATSTRKQIPATGIGVGSTKGTKIAKANQALIKQSHKALDELHGRIKAAPSVPPVKTPVAPVSPALAGPAAVERGTFSANPRPNPVEHPNEPAPMRPQPPATPIKPNPFESEAYKSAPQTLSSQGGGGANYTADELAAFKKKHGIL